MEENKYNVSYFLDNTCTKLITIVWIPLKEFGEDPPIFTEEESKEVVKFINNHPVPNFSRDLSGWNSFRKELNNKIYELYGK